MKTYMVKPLVWECISAVDGSHSSPIDGKVYRIRENKFGWGWRLNDGFFNNTDNEKSAKAECQADWDARLLTALVEVEHWQDVSETNTPPVNEDVLTRWPMRKLDEETEMPTGEITSISTVIGFINEDGRWDDYNVLEDTNASWRCSDDETAFAPIQYMLIQKPKETLQDILSEALKNAGVE